MSLKPGYLTTEFWGKTAVEIAVLLSALTSHLSPKWAAASAALAEGLYALGRGWAKSSPALKPPPNPAPPAA